MDPRVETSVKKGFLVCPETKQELAFEDERLITADGKLNYAIEAGVPILLKDRAAAREYVESSAEMIAEHRHKLGKKSNNLVDKVRARLNQMASRDYRTPASIEALSSQLNRLGPGSLALSIGGGPIRVDPKLLNVNIDRFTNVDIVADAHELPFGDGVVDFIHCEAVLEHLARPELAVREMFRTLKVGGTVFAATPFMAPYHGFPNHFQNFTLTGHGALFKNQGFEILSQGTCVGPLFTMTVMVSQFIEEYIPKSLRRAPRLAWKLSSTLLRPLDRYLNERDNAHVMAQTTFVLAMKVKRVKSGRKLRN